MAVQFHGHPGEVILLTLREITEILNCERNCTILFMINPLALSDPFMGCSAQLTSRRCILNTYSTDIRTEYFKRAA
jgi:hypothetical protein